MSLHHARAAVAASASLFPSAATVTEHAAHSGGGEGAHHTAAQQDETQQPEDPKDEFRLPRNIWLKSLDARLPEMIEGAETQSSALSFRSSG